MHKNHKIFLKRLKQSLDGVLTVAHYLILRGHSVYIPGMQQAASHKDYATCSDEGDLFVIQDRKKMRLEIKQKFRDFTCYEDFSYNTMLLGTKYSWDLANPKPVAYVILNRAGTHAAIIEANTYKYWVTETVADRALSGAAQYQTYYACPTEHVIFKCLKTDLG